ncbi:MAG: toll/interleukin-1 receptor domain-containing protein [Oscillospiraceae bacterium]|nr:toll/interleukin-1 receptor domain-containing protein [Oscillospiraceae bacterium]
MEKIRDVFISHNSADNRQAQALYDLLKSRDPELDIFLDCSPERPLEPCGEWEQKMLREAGNSRYLIFLASRGEFLEQGHGWVYPEVHSFSVKNQDRKRLGRTDRTIGWFGILLDGCPFSGELLEDPEHGEQYRLMYSHKQLLCLQKGEEMESAAQRIWDKFCTMVEGGGNALAAEVLDKVHAFAGRKQAADPMFCPSAICDELLPNLSWKGACHPGQEERGTAAEPNEEEDEVRDAEVTYTEVLQMVNTASAAILGAEGGCGKTSLLTKLFYHYLPAQEDISFFTQPGGMIPLYVDAKTLAGKNHLILRHLARVLYDEVHADTAEYTSETVEKLGAEFARECTTPRYLLLVDGYNEIPARVRKDFDEEIREYLPGGRYQNVRLLITSRHMQLELPEEVYRLNIKKLTNLQVVEYLRERKLLSGKLPAKLMEILSTPMYLRLYSQTAAGEGINSKGDLLAAFVRWQQKKDQSAAGSEDRKALTTLLLTHLLPMLAHRLTMESATDSAYVFTKSILREVVQEAQNLLKDEDYGDYYADAYWDMFDTSGVEALERRKLADLAAEYFVKNSKLLRQEEDGSFVFVHQIYRDFFCAWFIAEEMKRAVKAKKPSALLHQRMLSADVREFTADLLQEQMPVCRSGTWRWDYRCNDISVVYRLICQARTASQKQDRIYVANLLELLKYARKNDLSGCDFSGLDLRSCDLRTCVLTNRDGQGYYPTSFAGAWIDRENLICDSHFAPILDGCVGNGRVASVDSSGIIRIRVMPNINGVTEKIITGVDPRVRRILFAPEGDRLFAMTPHEILELPIPAQRESVAQPRVLLKTTKRLRSISLDEKGKLCFTTVFNAFNPKPVTEPDAPDVRDFYGLNSAAAVNTAGNQLAFVHVADTHEALRIYDYDAKKGEWVEKKYGYYLLLDGFITELVQTLKELSLYEYFPDDFAQDRKAGKPVPQYSSYFEYIRRQFYDRNHDHDQAPRIILRDRIYAGRAELSQDQKQRLDDLAETWAQKIRDARQKNPLLINMAGRQIESVDYKDENTLLVCYVNCYDHEKNRNLKITNSVLLEMDTRTMKTRFLSHYGVTNKQRCPLKACYQQGHMLIVSRNLMTVWDHQQQMVARIENYETGIERFLSLGEEGFLAIAQHFIYQFDPMGRCVAGWSSIFKPTNCNYVTDEEGRDYLVRTETLRAQSSGKPSQVLDLSTGSYQQLAGTYTWDRRTSNSLSIGDRQYKICAGELTAFEKSRKVDGFAIAYKLFVAGCDFRGIQGTLSDQQDLCQLSRYGAVTDPLELPVWQVMPEKLQYKPASQPWTLRQTQEAMPFLCHREYKARVMDRHEPLPGGENLSTLKIWSRIYEDSYAADALEAADMSILEWTGRLGLVTAEMVCLLIRAGMVEPPTGWEATQEAVSQRLEQVLHSKYRLLRRYRFCRDGGGELPVTWYALSAIFGVPLVRKTGGTARRPDADSDYAQRRQLAVNQWFCRMAAAYPGKITRYAFYEKFASHCHWYTTVEAHGFVVVDKQPLFLLVTRRPFDKKREEKTDGTLDFLCWLISHYKHLTHNNLPEDLEQPPAVVIVGEDYAHCMHLNGLLRGIAPFVRKLYTYDALIHGNEADPPEHFSFQRGGPVAEDVLDLN